MSSSLNNNSYTPDELRAMALNLFLNSNTGVVVKTEELRRQAFRASGTLQTLALLQTFLAFAFWVAVLGLNLTQKSPVMVSAEILTAVSVLFWILYHWALAQPLPAAIVGLAVYLCLSITSIIALFRVSQVTPGGGILPYILILRLFVMSYLLRAIIAGVRHRRLRQQAAAENANPTP